jgi:hypothetical protein
VRHFLVVTAFAIAAAVVFGTVAKDSPRDRLLYGLKVFVEFLVIGLVLGWVLYFLPF